MMDERGPYSPPRAELVSRDPAPMRGEPAPVGHRFIANLIDNGLSSGGALLLAVLVSLVALLLQAVFWPDRGGEELAWSAFLAVALSGMVLGPLILGVIEVTTGRSPGKRLLKLKVVDARGGELSRGKLLARYVVKLLVIQFFWPAALMVLARDRRAPWDHAVGSQVVRQA
jgi:uncharacterized RDD family membrane protein YckC